jgi:hypothetical protein
MNGERIITSREGIGAILSEAEVCRIALSLHDRAYMLLLSASGMLTDASSVIREVKVRRSISSGRIRQSVF